MKIIYSKLIRKRSFVIACLYFFVVTHNTAPTTGVTVVVTQELCHATQFLGSYYITGD